MTSKNVFDHQQIGLTVRDPESVDRDQNLLSFDQQHLGFRQKMVAPSPKYGGMELFNLALAIFGCSSTMSWVWRWTMVKYGR